MCSHLKAAAQVTGGFTPALRTAAADHLVATAQICVDEALGCHCMALANPLRPVLCVPLEGACTCHDRAMHGTCCHLLAAARLPEFHGVELPSGPLQGGRGAWGRWWEPAGAGGVRHTLSMPCRILLQLRGVTTHVDGTLLRNGAPHKRRSGRRKG